jgi:hypothetical protein
MAKKTSGNTESPLGDRPRQGQSPIPKKDLVFHQSVCADWHNKSMAR